jgi:hypothetical protein
LLAAFALAAAAAAEYICLSEFVLYALFRANIVVLVAFFT